MASITGLQSGDFTDIDVTYSIAINGDIGQTGQVLGSDGNNTLWINGSSIDREDLTAADTTITISGDGTYDGQVARTIKTNKVPNAITFATDGTGSRTGTFDGSSAITIDNRDTDTTYQAGDGIEFNPFTTPESIVANTDNTTIINTGGAGNKLSVLKVPNTLTFTGYTSGTFDGSSSLNINLVNTEYTAGNGIQISGSNQIQTKTDNITIRDSGGGSGNNLEVIKVPNTLTFTGYTSGTFDGSSSLNINLVDTNTTYSAGSNLSLVGTTFNLNKALTGIDSLTFTSTPSGGGATALVGNNYPAAGYQTPMTYFNLLSSTNLISPYFLHDVYDPSSAVGSSLSTTYTALFSSNLKNSFTAQSTSCCIELFLYNYGYTGNRILYLQLGDNTGTEWSVGTSGGGYGTGTRSTDRNSLYTDETDRAYVTQIWYLQGLSVGTTYTINPMAKTSSTLNFIYAGGNYPACILRGYYI